MPCAFCFAAHLYLSPSDSIAMQRKLSLLCIVFRCKGMERMLVNHIMWDNVHYLSFFIVRWQ